MVRQSGAGGAEQRRERGLAAALRRPGAPEGGMRVAYSYVVSLLAWLLAVPLAVGVVTRLYDSARLCADDDGLGCAVLGLGSGVALGSGVVMAAGAWFFRLGWRWFVASVALGLLLLAAVVGLTGDLFSPLLLLVVAIPAVAAVSSDPSLPHHRARTWAVVVAAALGVAALAVAAGALG